MPYRIEWTVDMFGDFYSELLFRNVDDKTPLALDGIGFSIGPQSRWFMPTWAIAGTSTGEITTPELGLLAIRIPLTNFQVFGVGPDGIDYAYDYGCGSGAYAYGRQRKSIPFTLTATDAADTSISSTIATGTFSFGN